MTALDELTGDPVAEEMERLRDAAAHWHQKYVQAEVARNSVRMLLRVQAEASKVLTEAGIPVSLDGRELELAERIALLLGERKDWEQTAMVWTQAYSRLDDQARQLEEAIVGLVEMVSAFLDSLSREPGTERWSTADAGALGALRGRLDNLVEVWPALLGEQRYGPEGA